MSTAASTEGLSEDYIAAAQRFLLILEFFPDMLLALLSRILFANLEVMHTPRSEFTLPFDIRNMKQIRTKK